jgi:hypothetical protein
MPSPVHWCGSRIQLQEENTMSITNTNIETIELDDLATITGGLFRRAPAGGTWGDAYASGKTLDVLKRNHGKPSWLWR